MKDRIVLGIETSCDETAAAIVINGKLAVDITTTQILHQNYGGVVPELASRAHEQLLLPAVRNVIERIGITPSELDAVAATSGPGLAGALLVGVSFAKGFAAALDIPWLAVNHLEGHIWSLELTTTNPATPFLALIASGGHTLLIGVHGFGEYEKLGSTRDDAAGEVLDKVGRMMGYGFPAGADLDRDAMNFSGTPVRFPRAKLKDEPLGFSFSGLKTAVLYYLRHNYPTSENSFIIPEEDKAAIATGLMAAVSDMLVKAIATACESRQFESLVFSGGVASSRFIKARMSKAASELGIPLYIPPQNHCTDNGAMIANIGYHRYQLGQASSMDESIDPSADLFAL